MFFSSHIHTLHTHRARARENKERGVDPLCPYGGRDVEFTGTGKQQYLEKAKWNVPILTGAPRSCCGKDHKEPSKWSWRW